MKQYAALDDTVYFWFAANDTSGSGGDGATPAADVRLAGAAADVAPVYSPTPVLLSHANYPAGAYEIAIAATAGNGFAANNVYAVFCTLAIDGQNPTGFVGSFDLKPIKSNVMQIGDGAQSATDLKDFADTGYDPSAHRTQAQVKGLDDGVITAAKIATDAITAAKIAANAIGSSEFAQAAADKVRASVCVTGDSANSIGKILYELYTNRLTSARAGHLDNLSVGAVALASGVDLTKIHGVALTETVNGYLAAAFTKLFDVETPLLVSSDAMRGTNSAALAAVCTEVRLAHLNADISSRSSHANPTSAIKGSPGKTIQEAYDNERGTNGAYTGTPPTTEQIKTKIEEAGSKVTLIKAQTDKMNFVATDIKATLDGEKVAITDAAETQMVDAICDEPLTGATHNVPTSLGKRIRQIAAYAILSGTAQTGTATTITLAATVDVGDGIINRNLIVIVGGTGVGQTRTITDYDNTTKVCVINREWRIDPDDTSEYQILADDTPLVVDHGIARGGTATTITLREYASSEDDNIYECNIIGIIGGKGRGQARLVGSYDCTSKIVTICGKDWKVIPDTTSVYVMVPYGTTCTSCVGAYALSQIVDAVSDAEIGSGALSCTWTQKDEGGVPMDNVKVWVCTDEAGSNVIAGTLLTDANGEVNFMLDAGTYYVFRERASYNFTNPQEWSVS